QESGGSVAALFNIFSGGALENCAVFSLGVMPYISASIMLQLLTAVIPQLGKLAKEDGGRQKIMQFTRYATILLCVFQGYLLAISFENPQSNPFLQGIMDTINQMGILLVSEPGWSFRVMTVITLTAGTMFLMWLGGQISERGIGNGISMLIFAGIVARLPTAVSTTVQFVREGEMSILTLLAITAFMVLIVAVIIFVERGQRRIPVQYAKRAG